MMEVTHSPDDLGFMAKGFLGKDFLNVQGVPNRSFLSAVGYEQTKGFLHPYVGRAGLPTLELENIGKSSGGPP